MPIRVDIQDYLYELWSHVKKLAPESHDSHLFALEVRLHHCKLHRMLMFLARRAVGSLT